MCGRFTSFISPELATTIKEYFRIRREEGFEPRYNIAPTQQAWVIRQEGDYNRIDKMKWGLIPSWSKDTKIASHTINARCETVHEKPAFRHAIKYNRCIIPAAGFYDWQPPGGRGKQPYYFHMADGSHMCFAGLWEWWKGMDSGEEKELETFSILTTNANEIVSPIHDRMPVILRPEDYNFWLNREMHDSEQLQGVYQPFPADRMEAYQVSSLVNNVRFDSPACIARI